MSSCGFLNGLYRMFAVGCPHPPVGDEVLCAKTDSNSVTRFNLKESKKQGSEN